MSDTVTNSVGHSEAYGSAAAGNPNSKVPLSDLFADVLNKAAFAEQMLSQPETDLARDTERDDYMREDYARDDGYDVDRDDAEPADDTRETSRDDDDRPDDGDTAEARDQSADQSREGDGQASPDVVTAFAETGQAAANATAENAQKTGPIVNPNAAAANDRQSKAENSAAGQARAAATGAEAQAAAHNAKNPAATQAVDQNNQSGAKPGSEKAQAGANGQQANTAAQNSAATADAAATDKPQTNNQHTQQQAQTSAGKNAENPALLAEQHTLQVRAGAKRAAELHHMKTRLSAHRDAIKEAIAQSSNGAASTQSQNNTNKPSVEVTASTTPPAPETPFGPQPRPAAPVNAAAAGTTPGQAGATAPLTLVAGDAASTGTEQSTVTADRQAAASNAARNTVARPVPAQLAYQPAEQIKVHIQQMVNSGADRIQVKLSPASLGRVEVALEVSPDKAVQAVVYAENRETLEMLERDGRVLQKAFEEAGMKLDSDGLTFKQGQSGNPDAELADGSGQTENGDGTDADGLETESSADGDTPTRRQHDGVLDVEI